MKDYTLRWMRVLVILFTLHSSLFTVSAQEKHWFVSANLSPTLFYCNEELDHDFSKSPFKRFRNNLGISLAVGRWFSPEIALRTKLNGFWGRYIISEDASANANTYFVLNEQVLFDVINIFCGSDPDRPYHLVPFFGGGFGRNMSYNRWATNLSVGILNQFKLTDRLMLNAELGYTLHTREFSGHDERKLDYHSLKNEDQQWLLELGITYNFM